jgi:hypothetical protein
VDTDDLLRRLAPLAETGAKCGLFTALWQDRNGAHVVMSTSLPWTKRTIRTTATPGDAIEIEIHGGLPVGDRHDKRETNSEQTPGHHGDPAPDTTASDPHAAAAAADARSWRELGALVRLLGRASRIARARLARSLRTRSTSRQ